MPATPLSKVTLADAQPEDRVIYVTENAATVRDRVGLFYGETAMLDLYRVVGGDVVMFATKPANVVSVEDLA